MNQLNTIVNYGKIHVTSKTTDLKKRISLVFFSISVKAMGRIEEIRTKRERHHIMKR